MMAQASRRHLAKFWTETTGYGGDDLQLQLRRSPPGRSPLFTLLRRTGFLRRCTSALRSSEKFASGYLSAKQSIKSNQGGWVPVIAACRLGNLIRAGRSHAEGGW